MTQERRVQKRRTTKRSPHQKWDTTTIRSSSTANSVLSLRQRMIEHHNIANKVDMTSDCLPQLQRL